MLGFVYRRRRCLFAFGGGAGAMLYTHSWGTFFFIGSLISLIPSLLVDRGSKRLMRDAAITFSAPGSCTCRGSRRCCSRSPTRRRRGTTPPRFGAPIQISRDVLGGDRITMVLVLAAAIGLAPLFTRAHRRRPEAAACC